MRIGGRKHKGPPDRFISDTHVKSAAPAAAVTMAIGVVALVRAKGPCPVFARFSRYEAYPLSLRQSLLCLFEHVYVAAPCRDTTGKNESNWPRVQCARVHGRAESAQAVARRFKLQRFALASAHFRIALRVRACACGDASRWWECV